MRGIRWWERTSNRSQSEVIGFVLVLAITIVSAAGVVALGDAAITDTKQSADLKSAENAMTQLDSQASVVAHGSSESRTVSITKADPSQLRVEETAGEMEISIKDGAGNPVGSSPYNIELGRAVYEQGDTTIAYQGGGVWKKKPGRNSVMVSPPEFDYTFRRGGAPTLTLPLVTIEGSATSDSIRVTQPDATNSIFPSGSVQNPLRNGEVKITVKSEFYRAWGRFFEERTSGSVTYDDPNQKVTVELVIPRNLAVSNALASGAASLALDNAGSIDSYNSEDGPYSDGTIHPNEKAPVAVDGDFDPTNSVVVKGSVQATGDAFISNSIDVYGETIIDGRSEISNTARYRDRYSTGKDLKVSSDPDFDNDVIVGSDLIEVSGAHPIYGGNVYVGGADENGDGNVLDDGGDVTLVKGEINGDLIAAGDVVVNKNAVINGEVIAGGTVTVDGTHSFDITADGNVIIKKNAQLTGNVNTNDEVRLNNDNAKIIGNVVSGRDVDGGNNGIELGGSSVQIDGDATAADGISDTSKVTGTPTEDEDSPAPSFSIATPKAPLSSAVDFPDAVDSEIDNKGTQLADPSNDNGDAGADIDTSTNTLTGCSSTCTLESGDYYLSSIDIDGGETLELDTTDGDINVYIDGSVEVGDSDGRIEIVGDNRVKFWVNNDFVMNKQSKVLIPDDRTPQFWVFMKNSKNAKFQNDAIFRGVVYGPPSSTDDGVDVTIENQAELYGAILGDVGSTSNNNLIHYDESLDDEAVTTGGVAPTVTFLHISETEVKLEDT